MRGHPKRPHRQLIPPLSTPPALLQTKKNTASLLLATAPRAALAARALRQVDASVRQESAHHKILSALRRSGGDAGEAAGSGYAADLGSQNFEKKASWRTMNNVRSTLQRYAKPTDGGLRGEVASRYHAKREGNDSGDLEDSNHYLEQAAQKNMRVMMVQAQRERTGGGGDKERR